MSKAQHTPGPWSVWGDTITDDAKARHLAVIKNGAPETEANARLIAAAPDLMEAINLCVLVLSGDEMSKSTLIRALEKGVAAIAKAKGD
jgi:hypothetical protein